MTERRIAQATDRIAALAARYALAGGAAAALECLVEALVTDPLAPTAVRDPGRVLDDHLADSLVALELPEVRAAGRVVDIGAGAGLPGLPVAIARPEAEVVLLESARRKCAFIAGVVERCGVANASIANARAEAWPEGLGRFDVAMARAVAPPAVLLEYAAPLLTINGVLIAWRGRRDPEAEAAAAVAAEQLGMRPAGIRRVVPYQSAEYRHLHLWSKVSDTPERFPRRPGMALKRPLGGRRLPSDRVRR